MVYLGIVEEGKTGNVLVEFGVFSSSLPDPYLHVPFYCDEAFFYFCHIDWPATVVWSQDFQVPHFSLNKGEQFHKQVQTFQSGHYWQVLPKTLADMKININNNPSGIEQVKNS